jgi:type I restriction enzyme, S subunit
VPKSGYKRVKWLFEKEIEIPEEWELKRIKELAKINPEQIKDNYNFNEIEYVDISSVEEFQIKKLNKFQTNERPSRAQRIIKNNDIIISTVRPYLKSFSLINFEKSNLVCSTGFTVVRSKIFSDNNFLFAYFKSHLFESNYIREMEGMAYPAITSSVVSNSSIPIPNNKKERERIGIILSNVDNLIDSYDKTIQTTKKLKKGLMQTLLTKGIGHKKFKKVKWLFGKEIEIPEEWDIQTLSEISQKLVVGFVGTCESFYTDKGGVPMIRTTNVNESKLDLSNLKYVKKEFHIKNKKSQIFENDLLVSRHGESGEACLVRGLKEANCMNIVIIRCKNEILPVYFEFAFNSRFIRQQIKRTTAGGVQGVVNTGEIAKNLMLIPSMKEQQKIVSILSSVDDEISKLESKKKSAESLKKGLMQKLLTGQIRVTV